MEFGKKLKEIRKEKNISQEELAKFLQTSRSNIANYENNSNMPSVEMLEKIAEFFDISIDYLLGKTDIRKNESNKDIELLKRIGFDLDKYEPPTKEQKEKIKEFAEFILKNNKKDQSNE